MEPQPAGTHNGTQEIKCAIERRVITMEKGESREQSRLEQMKVLEERNRGLTPGD